jgi:hypothetical protein
VGLTGGRFGALSGLAEGGMDEFDELRFNPDFSSIISC